MSLQVLLKKSGGSATKTMNGWPKLITVLVERGALIVLVNLFAGTTVYKPKILNCQRNGIQPKTEILHQRTLPLAIIRKFGGSAKKVMNGRPLLEAELRELDAPFAWDYAQEL